jgi:hypothetical protein
MLRSACSAIAFAQRAIEFSLQRHDGKILASRNVVDVKHADLGGFPQCGNPHFA